jgi:hypothetical protein
MDEYIWCDECRRKDREGEHKRSANRELRQSAMSLFGISKEENDR